MFLDLREIIERPGASVPFVCELSTERLDFPAVAAYLSPPGATGTVANSAGVLTLSGVLQAELLCRCDRCAALFEQHRELALSVPLAAELQDEDNPDIFLLQGDSLDLQELLETCFILDMDAKFLCREDCAGLCAECGANLNDSPCGCHQSSDPRLAVLQQLLDDKDQ